ncbi:MAG: hypothetical protein ACO1SX_25650 [Actinomycetota bacterium]
MAEGWLEGMNREVLQWAEDLPFAEQDRADGAALRKLRERYREATIYYQADLPCPYEVDFPGGEVQAPTLPEAAEKAVGFVVYVPTAAESVLG